MNTTTSREAFKQLGAEAILIAKDIKAHPLQWAIMLVASGFFGSIFLVILTTAGRHPAIAWTVAAVAALAFLMQSGGDSYE